MKKERYNPEEYTKPKREVYDTESNNGGVKRACKKYKIGFYKNPYGSSAYFDDVHNIDRFCRHANKNDWDVDEVVKLFKDASAKLKHASYTESKDIVNVLNKKLLVMFPTKAEKKVTEEMSKSVKDNEGEEDELVSV